MNVFLAVLALGSAHAPAADLDAYLNKARVLVVTAPTASNLLLRQQDRLLAGARLGIEARDLVVVRAVGPSAIDASRRRFDADAIRAAVGLSTLRFGVVLIGKDGGVKLKRSAPLAADALFQTIDAMPMRRDERNRRGR